MCKMLIIRINQFNNLLIIGLLFTEHSKRVYHGYSGNFPKFAAI